ncbi:MAG TPA: type II toxin-antitoxin system VapC family toxin [Terriglobia bacterium]|nr:type II toxin-antitoxin system VapC family toxin [Terriglobia bacterium]
MSIYADTSFLVSLYIPDKHSPMAERQMASNPALWFTPLHLAEWTHAVEQQVFRGVATRAEADIVLARFQQHRESGLWREVALPDSVFELCADLARRHTARLGVRTLDTLHVTCALELKAQRFWTFDERQKKLARAAGLKTS